MDIQKTLLSQFEILFKEWKEYNTFFEKNNEEVTASIKERVKEIIDAPDNLEKATQFVIDTKTVPMLYATDLNNLKERVLTAYELVKGLIEIPESAEKELEQLKNSKNKLMFIIEKGTAKEINPDLIKHYKDRIPPSAIQEVVKAFKNIKDLENL